MGQMASMFRDRQQGNLLSTSEVNPMRDGKEHCKAITLRRRKLVETNIYAHKKKGNTVEENNKNNETPTHNEKNNVETVGNTGRELKILVENTPLKVKESPIEEKPNVPHTQRLRRKQLDQQFEKFMEIFKKLHINIPFAEALEQMPRYAKFMKEILAKKRKLGDYETVALSEECSAILQKKLPLELKDPGSFTIPCAIGDAVFEKALCDLGANINFMSMSIFEKLNLGKARPTTITLQLVDRSLTHPHGIIKDVLVKVDKFIFPAYFIILDIEEDK